MNGKQQILVVTVMLTNCLAWSFESALWPGEGRPVLVAKVAVALHVDPVASSPAIKGPKIQAGEHIDFDSTTFRTQARGIAIAERDFTLAAANYGRVERLSSEQYYGPTSKKVIPLKTGEKLSLLQYRAEGEFLFELNGDVLTAFLGKEFKVLKQPETEWWIRVVRKGKPAGWALVDSKAISEQGRKF